MPAPASATAWCPAAGFGEAARRCLARRGHDGQTGLAGLVLMAAGACSPDAPTVTAVTAPPLHPLSHPVFNEAYTDGYSVDVGGTLLRFRSEHIGDIRLGSGWLLACDPLVACAGPFTKPAPVGTFPVQLAIAETAGDRRVAFARIVLAPGRIETREPAAIAGQDVATLKRGEFFGYPADSGTGAFMDADAWQAHAAEQQRGPEKLLDRVLAELQKNGHPTYIWYLHETGKGAVAMFSSGYGHGAYPTYYGYDKTGRMVAVITDFGLVPWESGHRRISRFPRILFAMTFPNRNPFQGDLP